MPPFLVVVLEAVAPHHFDEHFAILPLLRRKARNFRIGLHIEAVEGGAPMSPEVAYRVIKLFREIRPPEKVDHDLTPHEMRLLKLLVDGHNYTTAAEELGVSFNTIKFHMRHIYEKLQVRSRSQAVAKFRAH